MKKWTKLVSLMLTLVMVLGMLPQFWVSAAYENTHVNTGNQAYDIVEVAKTQIGYTEGSNNDTKYNRWFGRLSGFPSDGYGYAWCQTFVAWCANQAGISTSDIPKVSGTISAKQTFINNGTYHTGPYEGGSYTPKKGDIIYFYSSATDSKHHVGIVSDCVGGIVYTIEGNKSNKVEECSYSVTYGNIRGYGVPNYNNSIICPTFSTLQIDKSMVKVGEEVLFSASSDYATGFSIGINNTTGRYLTQEMINGQLSVTFSEEGSYSAYVTAYNSAGYVDSNWIGFTVYDTLPSMSILESDKAMVAVGEEITFTATSDLASAYWIGIDNVSGRYLTQEMPNGTLTLTFNEPGSYAAYVTSLNDYGYIDSAWINFTVYDKAPTWGKIKSEWGQYAFTVGDTIPLLATSDLASEYWLAFYKGNERILTDEMINGRYAVTLTEPGEYSAYVTAANSYGYIDSEWISFIVYDQCPTWGKLDIINYKSAYLVGDVITFSATSDYATDYWIGIDRDSTRTVTENMKDGLYTLELTESGNYLAYVSISNSLGGLDSEPILFTVYDIDLNSDGSVTILDLTLLQKYLLTLTPFTEAQFTAADLNSDGAVDGFDLALLKRMLLES